MRRPILLFPSATVTSAWPPPTSTHGRLRRHGFLGRRGALSSRDPRRHRRSISVPSRHGRREEEAKMGGGGWRKTEGCHPSPSPPYKGARSGSGRLSQLVRPIKVAVGEAVDRPCRQLKARGHRPTCARLPIFHASVIYPHSACGIRGVRSRHSGKHGTTVPRRRE